MVTKDWENRIEIEGDLKKNATRIKAVGRVAWRLAISSIAAAVFVAFATPAAFAAEDVGVVAAITATEEILPKGSIMTAQVSKVWQKRCLACGKIETSTTGKHPPSGTPNMSGKCPNTPSGKHNPVYEAKP